MRTELFVPDPPIGLESATMRPWRVDDAVVLMRAWSDPEIERWNPVPDDRSLNAAQRWIERSQLRLEQSVSLDLCIVDNSDERVLGEVGLSSFDHDRSAAMIGWWLLPEGRSRGLATHAVSSLGGWAMGAFELAMLVARCGTDNTASQRVAERAGFVNELSTPDGHELWVRRR